jgi:hypothetical protein
MSTEYKGEALWNEHKLKYSCGCVQVVGKLECPIHQKPMKEQMIYGNDKLDSLNEKDRYEKERLNE